MSISEILMLLTLVVTIVHVTFEIIAVCVFNAQATSANGISQRCHFERHYFENCDTWKIAQKEKQHKNDKKKK